MFPGPLYHITEVASGDDRVVSPSDIPLEPLPAALFEAALLQVRNERARHQD